jgi:hypothetical protein
MLWPALAVVPRSAVCFARQPDKLKHAPPLTRLNATVAAIRHYGSVAGVAPAR